MIHIRYVSTLCSEKVLDYIFKTAQEKPQLAAQKFHRLLSEGLSLHQDTCRIQALSTIPVNPANHRKRFWRLPAEAIGNVIYRYIPMLNIGLMKNVGVFLYTLLSMLAWRIRPGKKETKVVLCDVLNLSTAAASLLACKLRGIPCVGIVTDIPGMMVVDKHIKMSLQGKLYGKLLTNLLTKFSGYVLLTEQMNPVVNPKQKPYMIMEGLADINMSDTPNPLENKAANRILIYAGGLFEKYGVKMMIEAFMKLKNPHLRLHLYGSGDMVEDIEGYTKHDSRIKYLGLVPNQQVVADQLKATLLINPRPTAEEFTKFSFPSKNMEYLVSGTSMIVTKLPGMPEEYYPHVYLFEKESVEGMHNTLKKVLSQSDEELHQFGQRAKEFVLQYKNNAIQAGRILQFIAASF